MKILYEAGADINVFNNNFENALIFVVNYKKIGLLQDLIKMGCSLEFEMRYDRKTILEYTYDKKYESFDIFVEEGANLDIKNKKGIPNLHYVARKKDYYTMAYLIAFGADHTIKTPKGETCFDISYTDMDQLLDMSEDNEWWFHDRLVSQFTDRVSDTLIPN